MILVNRPIGDSCPYCLRGLEHDHMDGEMVSVLKQMQVKHDKTTDHTERACIDAAKKVAEALTEGLGVKNSKWGDISKWPTRMI